MPFTNPITAAKIATIDDELPRSAAVAPSVGNTLDDLYRKQIAQQATMITQSAFEFDDSTTTGLTFAYFDGILHDGQGDLTEVAAGTVILTDSVKNYVEYDRTNGVTANTSAFTANRLPLYEVTTVAGAIPAENVIDKRPFLVLFADVGIIRPEELTTGLNALINQVSLAVGAESANTIDVTIQVQNTKGTPASVAAKRIIEVWIADAVDGWESATVPDGGLSVTIGTAFDVITTDKRLRLLTNASGTGVVRLTHAAAGGNWYLAAKLDNRVWYSSIITFV